MSFRFEKLTTKAQQAIAYAQNKASVLGNPEITPVHLLASLLEETDGIVAPLLEKIDAPVQQLSSMVETEQKRQDSSDCRAEKPDSRTTKRQIRDPNCPHSGITANADAVRRTKPLITRRDQAILPSSGRPLGECRFI